MLENVTKEQLALALYLSTSSILWARKSLGVSEPGPIKDEHQELIEEYLNQIKIIEYPEYCLDIIGEVCNKVKQ